MNNWKNDCWKFFQKIVSTRSLSGQEKKLSSIIAKEMQKLNYDDVHLDRLGNVIGRIGRGRKKILYDAHIDTVGISEITEWKTDPFRATYRAGFVYGRGTCDDKGSLAAMVYAGGLIKQTVSRHHLKNDFSLYVSASVQEETAEGSGIKFLFENLKFRPDGVIIGEPSDLKIIRGHKGRAEIKLTVKGISGHASTPEKGENAIYKTLPLIKNIIALNEKYAHQKPGQLGHPVISVTKIETKNASTNTIPDNCSVYLDRRTIEGENKQKITRELKKVLGLSVKIDYPKKFFSAWILPENHYLLQSAIVAYKEVYQKNPVVTFWPFCTNGSFTMGEKKIPTIGFGPGKEKYCHCANERINFEDILKAIKFYTTFPLIFSQK